MSEYDGLVPVVGMGASAGGLDAISQVLEALPADLGMAFLIVSHMDARQESHLAEVLANRSTIPVHVADGQVLVPNRAYVIPPNTLMTIAGNTIVLHQRTESAARHMPIDTLFESMAQERPDRAIGIVLSGTGSDGARGIQRIKEAGGITLAQESVSATFDSMPIAAIATGCVDLVVRPVDIAAELARIANHPYFRRTQGEDLPQPLSDDVTLTRIFALLSSVYQADFTQYKASTIQRRLQRRMALNSKADMRAYLDLLRENPIELAALYNDLLIRVTSFFREEAIHDALQTSVFPALLKDRSHADPLRIWVPACATGEEVYSIAISLLEFLGPRSQDVTIQIFGTDLNEAAIDEARQGTYAENIAERVTPAQRQRYFVHENQRYRVAKHVRELCVFARQNVILDPPLSRMDLISCCNLLIYLDTGLQRRVLRHFHYALKPQGFLVLGPAESAEEESNFFKRCERHQRILYNRATPTPGALTSVLPVASSSKTAAPSQAMPGPMFLDNSQVQRKADGLLLSRFAPASILIDDRLNIVQFRGQTGPYLQHASGTASLNLHRVAHPGILLQLMPMVKEAQQSGTAVHRSDLRIESASGQREGSVEVIPLREPATKTSFCLIIFEAHQRSAKSEARAELQESEKDTRIRQLEEELDNLRDYLHATNEAYEAALEESRSAQEELQSSNEEFLSSNEELVTAREELQAANEELTTANEEMISRTREMQVLNTELKAARRESDFNANYAESLIDTVAHPLLVLDESLTVHRANHAFYNIFLTNPGATLDRGLFDLGDGQWDIPGLHTLIQEVLATNTPTTAYRVDHDFPGIGRKTMLVNARKVPAMGMRGARVLLAFEDVTLNEARIDTLHQDDRRKDEFIAMLAHELRNPLAPIRNAVQLMQLKVSDPGMARPLAMIDRQVTALTRLINDLMDVSRITRGKLSLETQPIDLVHLLVQVGEAAAPYMDQRGHQLSTILPDTPVVVMGDATRLQQVFGNLLNNAAKYTDRGGNVVLELAADAGQAIATVSDNGAGIAAGILPHVFDLFVQASDTRSRADGGLGIGLTLVRSIVEMHGGQVKAASGGDGQGTRMTVCLPLARPDAGATEGACAETGFPAAEMRARRMLIVDDNIDSANSMADVMRSWGHEVRVAYDGYNALDVARSFAPELALLDIGLPNMSGHALAGKLRALIGDRLVIIAITGYGQESDRSASRDAGFAAHLTKPVVLEELRRAMESKA